MRVRLYTRQPFSTKGYPTGGPPSVLLADIEMKLPHDAVPQVIWYDHKEFLPKRVFSGSDYETEPFVHRVQENGKEFYVANFEQAIVHYAEKVGGCLVIRDEDGHSWKELDNELWTCQLCGSFEGATLTNCPRTRDWDMDRVYKGEIDFRGGVWCNQPAIGMSHVYGKERKPWIVLCDRCKKNPRQDANLCGDCVVEIDPEVNCG